MFQTAEGCPASTPRTTQKIETEPGQMQHVLIVCLRHMLVILEEDYPKQFQPFSASQSLKSVQVPFHPLSLKFFIVKQQKSEASRLQEGVLPLIVV